MSNQDPKRYEKWGRIAMFLRNKGAWLFTGIGKDGQDGTHPVNL